jgi:hypothetical protein
MSTCIADVRALEAQTVEPLPERAVMSLVNANLAAPINAAVVANLLSDSSVAAGNAQQTAPIVQGLSSGPPTL